ncbi:hypothetical protein BGZ76_006986 [Entomortierella beljakovae]|nr:hypothetical protein BGZ76_006986 [Entomortierella beljakovae]
MTLIEPMDFRWNKIQYKRGCVDLEKSIPGIVNISRCVVMAEIHSFDGSMPCSLVSNPTNVAQLAPGMLSIQTIGESTMGVLNLAADPPTPSRNLTGAVGASGDLLKDLDGNIGIFFAFPDLSVRTEGIYTLKFSFSLLPE